MGRVNLCYLICGSAVRLAQAAGLHKEARMSSMIDATRTEERRTAYWSLYALESLACYGFGRPVSIGHNGQQPPYPEGQPFLLVLVKFSHIMHNSTAEIYEGRDRSLSRLWRSANKIRDQVMEVRNSLIGDYFRDTGDKVDPGPHGVKQIMLLNVMNHIMLLTYRPFLLFSAMLNARAQSGEFVDPNKMSIVAEGCRICVVTARNVINIIHSGCLINSLVKSLGYHGFFIEGASFAIVYAILLRDPRFSSDPENIVALNTAVECLDMISVGWPFKTTRDAIHRMITLLQRIDTTPGAERPEAPPSSPPKTVASLHSGLSYISTAQQGNRSTYGVPNPGLMDLTGWDPEFQVSLADLGCINFDFGFDMSVMDFQTFLNCETPQENVAEIQDNHSGSQTGN